MDGWWDCEKLDQFFHKVLEAELYNQIKKNWDVLFKIAWNFVLNTGRKSKAFEVGEKHYDIGNDLYRAMLDKHLTYTGGYWNPSVKVIDPWIEKYIFPNSMLPSIKQIGKSIEGLFVMEDWHSFGADYDKTLMAWYKNFEDNWDKIKSNYDERFYRMWRYYLLVCAGAFRARKNQLWQIVLSKKGVPGGYKSIRI